MVRRNIKDMRILIGGSSSKIFHLNEFAKELNNLGIETKVVFDIDFIKQPTFKQSFYLNFPLNHY